VPLVRTVQTLAAECHTPIMRPAVAVCQSLVERLARPAEQGPHGGERPEVALGNQPPTDRTRFACHQDVHLTAPCLLSDVPSQIRRGRPCS
jgi:hypothetical protein